MEKFIPGDILKTESVQPEIYNGIYLLVEFKGCSQTPELIKLDDKSSALLKRSFGQGIESIFEKIDHVNLPEGEVSRDPAELAKQVPELDKYLSKK